MALVDVYCLYNRARGTGLCFSAKYLYGIPLLHVLILFFFLIFCVELISPEDLLQACSLWEKFDVYVPHVVMCFLVFSAGLLPAINYGSMFCL
jgi:hypothetical protein